ncbi:extracellular solute-binding protein [Streptomyces phaeochromogenes]|uniref:ABC transporter substrate-binding protein n=1 Tax=Streptomyces phaeochromogenes TaxID=1923 RepID=UPI002DDC4A55|nr:extracellular solute-binding protein [Streptomyces phaeochromogenes]WRZ34645.1 extracellular solute-binding protein [Streptomyces phaeochromogenes]
MSKARTVSVAALLAVVPVALTACGGSDSASTSATEGTVTLVTDTKADVEPLIAAFEKKYPKIKVKLTVPAAGAIMTTVRTQLSAGTAPDVIRVWPAGGNPLSIKELTKQNLLKDLSSDSWTTGLTDADKTAMSIDGKVYGAPVTVTGIGALYNQQALAAVGATEPQTFSDVLALCAKAKAKGKSAFSIGAKDSWTTQMVPYALTSTLVYGPDPDFSAKQAKGTTTFADSGWKKGLTEFQTMVKEGCFQKSPNGTSYDESMNRVSKGDSVAVLMATNAEAALKQKAASGTTFGLFPLPATDNAADTYQVGGIGSAYAINAKAKHPALAQKLLDFISSPQGVALIATATGSGPALPAASSYHVTDVLKPILAAQKDGKLTAAPDQAWPDATVQAAHLTALQQVLGGQLDAGGALKKLDDAYAKANKK